jgi:uncharacterized repeat protein (TIGR03803 family)
MHRRSLAVFIPALLAIVATSHAQTYTESLLYSFSPTPAYSPGYGVIQASDGNFYGTTVAGGANLMQSTAFRLTPDGQFTTLYTFCSKGGDNCTDGESPYGLVEGPDGNFYGATLGGGTDTYGQVTGEGGTVFRLSPSGVYTVVYNFCGAAQCADGDFPAGPVIFGSDGNMYGATFNGGQNGYGSVFQLTTSGTLTSLYSFCDIEGCPDGMFPSSPLLQASDGNFYGYTLSGVYMINSAGAFANVGNFPSTNAGGETCGSTCGSLIQAADGNLYGTIPYNAAQDEGFVFSAAPSSGVKIIYSFCSSGKYPTCGDGENPSAPLVAGTDGNLYGVTPGGGPAGSDGGTFFRTTAAGALTTLYTFCASEPSSCTTASAPGAIQQGADGNFYGASYKGGANKVYGTVFKLTSSTPLAAPVQLSLSSASVLPGASLTRTYKVLAAYSTTLQQCYLYLTKGSTVTVLGKLSTTFTAGSASGSGSITAPTASGTYIYGLTCGGTESGFATLNVGYGSNTALTASPNPAPTVRLPVAARLPDTVRLVPNPCVMVWLPEGFVTTQFVVH